MKTFKLTEVQADAILNMRLRNLRKLEEMEIRAEEKALREERSKIKALIGSTEQQWKTIAGADQGGAGTPSGRRPISASAAPTFAEAPEHDDGRDRRGHGGARADHGRGVGEGLDPRAARPCQRSVGRHLQDRRRAEIRVPDRDHGEDSDLCQQRQVLHHRGFEAAGRARAWRAGAAVSSISSRTPMWWPRWPIRADANSWWRAARATASWCRKTMCSAPRARASRCSTSRRPTRPPR